MLIKYIIAGVYAFAVFIFFWLYLMAFSGVYSKSGSACILTSILTAIIYFGLVQPFIPLICGMFRSMAMRGQNSYNIYLILGVL
jgi:hypothetical protein